PDRPGTRLRNCPAAMKSSGHRGSDPAVRRTPAGRAARRARQILETSTAYAKSPYHAHRTRIIETGKDAVAHEFSEEVIVTRDDALPPGYRRVHPRKRAAYSLGCADPPTLPE